MTVLRTSTPTSRALGILILGVMVLGTTAALPLLHDAFHAPRAAETECPVHILQTGFSLVLLAVVLFSALLSRATGRLPLRRAPGFVHDPRSTAHAPRAPPALSV
ncbi:MAG TPA: hypothetical protein QGF95_15560 [Candidatus Latescibacteria bacterium]|jgi:hypothetical protein|nr:hypothetical protein [Candidatus Latescibacterota bacterium]HJP31961.1 hypothetical protein [Candidatus Latescibacterota bacterium]